LEFIFPEIEQNIDKEISRIVMISQIHKNIYYSNLRAYMVHAELTLFLVC